MPLNGRPIGETTQGKVAEALAMYQTYGGFGDLSRSTSGKLKCSNRSNAVGDILEFCLFPGGHNFRTEHLKYGIKRLKDSGQI